MREKKNGWKMHVHMAALRKVKKIFLATLWTRWRQMEGLPTRSPYVHEYKGHTKIYKPEDFGWPVTIKVRDIKTKGAPKTRKIKKTKSVTKAKAKKLVKAKKSKKKTVAKKTTKKGTKKCAKKGSRSKSKN